MAVQMRPIRTVQYRYTRDTVVNILSYTVVTILPSLPLRIRWRASFFSGWRREMGRWEDGKGRRREGRKSPCCIGGCVLGNMLQSYHTVLRRGETTRTQQTWDHSLQRVRTTYLLSDLSRGLPHLEKLVDPIHNSKAELSFLVSH